MGTKTTPRSHILIPGFQLRSDVDFSHLEHIGNYIVDAQPKCGIQAGDWADLPSLYSFDVGKKSAEGKRLIDDIQSVKDSINLLMKPIRKYNKGRRKKYAPRLVFVTGNHCDRLARLM